MTKKDERKLVSFLARGPFFLYVRAGAQLRMRCCSDVAAMLQLPSALLLAVAGEGQGRGKALGNCSAMLLQRRAPRPLAVAQRRAPVPGGLPSHLCTWCWCSSPTRSVCLCPSAHTRSHAPKLVRACLRRALLRLLPVLSLV